MTAVIAPVVPSARVAITQSSATRSRASTRALPLARLAQTPGRSTRYGLCVIDKYGRVSDRALIGSNLGWQPGTCVDLREDRGLILAAANDAGAVQVTRQGHLHLPVSLRRYCGLAAGDRVLLVADVSDGLLVLYPPSVLDAMVTGFRAFLAGGERS